MTQPHGAGAMGNRGVRHRVGIAQTGAFAVGRPYPEMQPLILNPDQLKALEGIFALDDKQTRSLSGQGTQWVSVRDGGRPAALIPHGR